MAEYTTTDGQPIKVSEKEKKPKKSWWIVDCGKAIGRETKAHAKSAVESIKANPGKTIAKAAGGAVVAIGAGLGLKALLSKDEAEPEIVYDEYGNPTIPFEVDEDSEPDTEDEVDES